MIPKIAIIGAGIAGLYCTKSLLNDGYEVELFEKSDRIGGRMKTDLVNGFQLDHGFHVIQTGYDLTKQIIDYDKLSIKPYEPGAKVIRPSKNKSRIWRLSDPFRRPFSSFKDAFGFFASPFDMLRVLKIRRRLKKMSVEEIFAEGDMSTQEWLQSQGFSQSFINRFFHPLFGGIFLESELRTNERLFKFIFRTMSNGDMVLPENGIQAVPTYLADQIPSKVIHLNSRVESFTKDSITINGVKKKYDAVIVAYDHRENLSSKHVWTIYFSASTSPLSSNHIMLNSEIKNTKNIISYISVPSDIQPNYSPDGKSLICVTVVGDKCEELGLINEEQVSSKVIEELFDWFGVISTKWSLIDVQHIANALPETDSQIFSSKSSNSTKEYFSCGDYMVHGSLEGTLISAKQTVQEVKLKLTMKDS